MNQNQRGASYLGIFALIIAAVFFIKVAVALFPAYYDDRVINQQIQEVLKNLPKSASTEEFNKEFATRLQLNNIRDLKAEEIAKAEVTGTGLKVKKSYQRQADFLKDTRFVTSFDKEFVQSSTNMAE